MTMADMLGAPICDPPDPIAPTSDPCPLPARDTRPEVANPTRRHLVRLSLVVATALCVGVAVGTYAIPHRTELAPRPTAAAANEVPAGVAGFAELFVATHLSAIVAAEHRAALYPNGGAPPDPSGLWVNRAATTAAVAVDENVWRVTVAAEVLEKVDDTYEPAGIQYYTVIVAQTDAQPMALSAPSRTPIPEEPTRTKTAPRYTGAVPPDQETAVVDFLTAYLTGNGEVARYVAPTARIALFSAPPYVSAEIVSIGADSLGRIRAQLTAVSASGATPRLEYTLEMTYESGVWEVLAMAPST